LKRLENQKCILTKENTRRRRFRFRKKQRSGQNFWPNPIQSNPIHGWIMNPVHVQLCVTAFSLGGRFFRTRCGPI